MRRDDDDDDDILNLKIFKKNKYERKLDSAKLRNFYYYYY
jgi:hypothetical protein